MRWKSVSLSAERWYNIAKKRKTDIIRITGTNEKGLDKCKRTLYSIKREQRSLLIAGD